jgi:uncharacterized protein YbaR (Trm112 family)
MISADLLKILCCPETHQPLSFADVNLVEQSNQRIEGGLLKNRGGKTVSEKLNAGLVRADGKFLYPIRGNLPIMLIDEAIPLD